MRSLVTGNRIQYSAVGDAAARLGAGAVVVVASGG